MDEASDSAGSGSGSSQAPAEASKHAGLTKSFLDLPVEARNHIVSYVRSLGSLSS